MESLARKDKKRSLKDFTYTDAEIAGEIYAAMNSTSFLGVSVSHLRYSYFVCGGEKSFDQNISPTESLLLFKKL